MLEKTLAGIKAVFLDLDGTIYLGDTLIEGSLDFLSRLEEAGIQRYFLSNNSSRSVKQYVSKLHGMGIPATADDVLLSTHDLLAWLADEGVSETYLVGTEGMREMLEDAGVATASEEPQYVVLGYDTEITYEKLSTASVLMHRGVPLVVSHPDMVCPSPDGGLPDTGAYMALFEATTGVKAAHVTGKPNAGMILHKVEELGLEPVGAEQKLNLSFSPMMLNQRLPTSIEISTKMIQSIRLLKRLLRRKKSNSQSAYWKTWQRASVPEVRPS